jgi:hypothetical protein
MLYLHLLIIDENVLTSILNPNNMVRIEMVYVVHHSVCVYVGQSSIHFIMNLITQMIVLIGCDENRNLII